MRLIDADELKETIVHNYRRQFFGSVLWNILDDIPTIDAEPVRHGRWLGEGDGYADGYPVMDVWYCSECDHCIDDGTDNQEHLPNYCPNCGAKMDAKEET